MSDPLDPDFEVELPNQQPGRQNSLAANPEAADEHYYFPISLGKYLEENEALRRAVEQAEDQSHEQLKERLRKHKPEE